MAKIKVVTVDPDGSAQLLSIDNELSTFQQMVGGYIEGVYQGDFTVYVNEEGLLQNLPFNTRIAEVVRHPTPLAGVALIVGPADDEGYDTDVPEHIIKHYELEN